MSSPPDAGRFGSARFRERPPQTPRKRMMAQGRKGHFMFDAKALLQREKGTMDEQYVRAFLEALFARGTRISTADAKQYLDEKLAAEVLTTEQHGGLARLIEHYSFWR